MYVVQSILAYILFLFHILFHVIQEWGFNSMICGIWKELYMVKKQMQKLFIYSLIQFLLYLGSPMN